MNPNKLILLCPQKKKNVTKNLKDNDLMIDNIDDNEKMINVIFLNNIYVKMIFLDYNTIL